MLLLSIVTSSLFLGCGAPASTENQRPTDSLFLGISLGMDFKEFYEHCWKLNNQKLVTHGPTNENVEYRMKNAFKDSVTMRFYPTFFERKVFEMPVTFTYDKWAPWNKAYSADSLLPEMYTMFKDWYGAEGWKEIDHPTQGKVYAKINGRTRINLFVKDDQFVQAVFTDLDVEGALKKADRERKEKPVENEE